MEKQSKNNQVPKYKKTATLAKTKVTSRVEIATKILVAVAFFIGLMGALAPVTINKLGLFQSQADYRAAVIIDSFNQDNALSFDRALLGSQIGTTGEGFRNGMGYWDTTSNSLPEYLKSVLRSDNGAVLGSLRFPYGTNADFYPWKGSLGPATNRQSVPAQWGDQGCAEANDVPITFGLEEFLKSAVDELGTEPTIVIGARVKSISDSGEVVMQEKNIYREKYENGRWLKCAVDEQPAVAFSSTSPDDAKRMVAYANALYDSKAYPDGSINCAEVKTSTSDDPKYWAGVRALCSNHEQPFGVAKWEIGNEISESPSSGGEGLSPELYGRAFALYQQKMTEVESFNQEGQKIELAVGADTHFIHTRGIAYLQKLFAELQRQQVTPSYFIIHHYAMAGSGIENYNEEEISQFFRYKLGSAYSYQGEGLVKEIRELIATYYPEQTEAIGLAMTEYNPSYHITDNQEVIGGLNSVLMASALFNELEMITNPQYNFTGANISQLMNYYIYEGTSNAGDLIKASTSTDDSAYRTLWWLKDPFCARNGLADQWGNVHEQIDSYFTKRPNFSLLEMFNLPEDDLYRVADTTYAGRFAVSDPQSEEQIMSSIEIPEGVKRAKIEFSASSPENLTGTLQVKDAKFYSESLFNNKQNQPTSAKTKNTSPTDLASYGINDWQTSGGAAKADDNIFSIKFPVSEPVSLAKTVDVIPGEKYVFQSAIKGEGWDQEATKEIVLLNDQIDNLYYNNGFYSQGGVWCLDWSKKSTTDKQVMTYLDDGGCLNGKCALAEGATGSIFQKSLYEPFSLDQGCPASENYSLYKSATMDVDQAIAEGRAFITITGKIKGVNVNDPAPRALVGMEVKPVDENYDYKMTTVDVDNDWQDVEFTFPLTKSFEELRMRIETANMTDGEQILFDNFSARLVVYDYPKLTITGIDEKGGEVMLAQKIVNPYDFDWTSLEMAGAPYLTSIPLYSPAAKKGYLFVSNSGLSGSTDVYIKVPADRGLLPTAAVIMTGDNALANNEAADSEAVRSQLTAGSCQADVAAIDAAKQPEVKITEQDLSSLTKISNNLWVYKSPPYSISRIEFKVQ